MKHFTNTLLLAFFLMVFFACSAPQPESQAKISIADASELIADNKSVIVLDVRTPAEFETGHIQNAVNIDINSDDFAQRVALLDRDTTYVIHCAANVENGRTDKSITVMNELGFTDLLDLEGGIIAWQQEGLEIVKM